ncbi:hypothetical protein [Natrononativus amylolyticus]|uniref:hypothetical protein n=1 Tax=Natrononativus amylolyticus TaxID=2963434 RepID=UPI0020CDE51D|nr:hypothetical protein [Natrononativus amylolyticus]
MTSGTDGGSERIFGYPRRTVLLEAVRISYAIGITGVITLLVILGLFLLNSGAIEGIESLMLLLFASQIALALGLYIYDRRHERDLIIADAAVRVVRPVAALIRLLRGGGP